MLWFSFVCWISQICASSLSMVSSEMEKCNFNLAFYFICQKRDCQWSSVLAQEQEWAVEATGITRLSGSGAEEIPPFWGSFLQRSHSITEMGSVFPLCQAGAEVLRGCSLQRMTGRGCTSCGENLWSEKHLGWVGMHREQGCGAGFLVRITKSHRSVQGPK